MSVVKNVEISGTTTLPKEKLGDTMLHVAIKEKKEDTWYFKNNEWSRCNDDHCMSMTSYHKLPTHDMFCEVVLPPTDLVWSYDTKINQWKACDEHEVCSKFDTHPPPSQIIYSCRAK